VSSLLRVELINPILLISIIVFDVGRRRHIGWFRIAEPLVLVGAIVPFFFRVSGLTGAGALLELVGVLVGVAAGLIALSQTRVYRSPRTRRAVSAAGAGYVAFWVVFLGARALFVYGASDWFPAQLGAWLHSHDITSSAFSDAFIFVAITPLLTRTLGLALRTLRLQPRAEVAPEIIRVPAAHR
jgi:hypothetical protein